MQSEFVVLWLCVAAAAVVVAVYFNLDNINQISIYRNLWGCTIRVSRIWQEIACLYTKHKFEWSGKKKRIQFNNIHVRGDGLGHLLLLLLLLLFIAFHFITIHWICMHINGKSVYCVVMCTARFIDIIFAFPSLYLSLARSRVHYLCAIVSSIKIDIDVRDVHVNLYSITKKWWISYQIYYTFYSIHSNNGAQSLTFDWLLSPVIFYYRTLLWCVGIQLKLFILYGTYSALSLSHFSLAHGRYRAVYLVGYFRNDIQINAIWKWFSTHKRRKNNEKIISRSAY